MALARAAFGAVTLGGIGLAYYFEWRSLVALEGDARKYTLHHFFYHGPRPSLGGITLPALSGPSDIKREYFLPPVPNQDEIISVEGKACPPCGYIEGRTATWRRYPAMNNYLESSLFLGGDKTIEDTPVWVDTDILNTVLLDQKLFFDAWRDEEKN